MTRRRHDADDPERMLRAPRETAEALPLFATAPPARTAELQNYEITNSVIPGHMTPAVVRASDPATSHRAAERIQPYVSGLQHAVWDAVRRAGAHGLTGAEAEELPGFRPFAPSTIRKRLSELHDLGYLATAGERRGLTIYVACAGVEPIARSAAAIRASAPTEAA